MTNIGKTPPKSFNFGFSLIQNMDADLKNDMKSKLTYKLLQNIGKIFSRLPQVQRECKLGAILAFCVLAANVKFSQMRKYFPSFP